MGMTIPIHSATTVCSYTGVAASGGRVVSRFKGSGDNVSLEATAHDSVWEESTINDNFQLVTRVYQTTFSHWSYTWDGRGIDIASIVTIANNTLHADCSYKDCVPGKMVITGHFVVTLVSETVLDDEEDAYYYISTAVGEGHGVTSGDGSYRNGEICTITAEPEEHYLFDRWESSSGDVITTPTHSFPVTKTETWTAFFKEGKRYLISTKIGCRNEYGQICYGKTEIIGGVAKWEQQTTGGGLGVENVLIGHLFWEGEECTILATPQKEYSFEYWEDLSSSTINTASYTFNVHKDNAFSAKLKCFEFYNITIEICRGRGTVEMEFPRFEQLYNINGCYPIELVEDKARKKTYKVPFILATTLSYYYPYNPNDTFNVLPDDKYELCDVKVEGISIWTRILEDSYMVSEYGIGCIITSIIHMEILKSLGVVEADRLMQQENGYYNNYNCYTRDWNVQFYFRPKSTGEILFSPSSIVSDAIIHASDGNPMCL